MEPKYKRVVLKLSGEALAGEKKMGLDMDVINNICVSIKKCVDAGAQIGIVVGVETSGVAEAVKIWIVLVLIILECLQLQ